ncbi:OLC1v1038912C1 [Oldenlandia corymbosa var. corymbosa]|uniref:OLC1v1038912C1 n=1 Tax=Oldenlandia corymbosa var. corymbosa TaxID=529605 RepID=A0AAV1D3I6_OLDCO|nr:OLC1v1038912C1 [Oldenlandia corymbosa var. corymbosa]
MAPCAPKMIANKVEIDKLNDFDESWAAIITVEEKCRLRANIHDESGSIQASIFGSIAEKILGFTATEIIENPEKIDMESERSAKQQAGGPTAALWSHPWTLANLQQRVLNHQQQQQLGSPDQQVIAKLTQDRMKAWNRAVLESVGSLEAREQQRLKRAEEMREKSMEGINDCGFSQKVVTTRMVNY